LYIGGMRDPDEIDAEALEKELRPAIGADQRL
jgi:hypothetical protein